MKKIDALRVFGLDGGAEFEDIKLAYRKACSLYHPDRNPAGLEMMKVVNGAWEALQDYVKGCVSEEGIEVENFGEEINEALNKIIHLGLTIEICGSWVWVSGDTRPHKDTLKEAGFKWAPKKMMWHFSPKGERSYSRGKYTMDEIRIMHGSVGVKVREFVKLGERAA